MPIVRRLILVMPVCLIAQAAPIHAQGVGGPETGRPANLCQELVAFVRQPEAGAKAAETPPSLATAVSAKSSGDTSAKPAAENTPQADSGQSG